MHRVVTVGSLESSISVLLVFIMLCFHVDYNFVVIDMCQLELNGNESWDQTWSS